MLDNLRNFGRTWTAKILLGVLILSVAGFGLPSIFLDLGTNTVARVGEQTISAREFDRLYRSQLNQFSAQTGQSPTAQQAMSFGLPGAVLGRLANDAAIDSLAERLNVGAADARVAQLVRSDPSFAGGLGGFDRQQFELVLQQAGYTESEFIALQREAARREQIGAAFSWLSLPQAAREIALSYENDRRTIEFVELNPVLFAVSDEPTEEQLQQFYEENSNRFVTEETRGVSLIVLTAETLAGNIEISDAQIEAEYERLSAQFTQVERRTVHQVALPDEAAAEQMAQAAGQGENFEDVVAELGLDGDVDTLGTVAQAELSDAGLADAAFGLGEGEFTVIDSAVGQRAVWVSQIEPGGLQPLEEVRDQIEQSLQIAQAGDLYLDAYDDIEEARAAFQPFDEVASQYGLEVYELDLTRNGDALADVAGLPEGTAGTVVEQVFGASETANVTPAINLGSNRTAFFTLDEVVPVREQALEEVRDQVVAAWQELETDMAMTRTAEDMVAAVDSGESLLTVASQQGLVPQASAPFDRSGNGAANVPAGVASSAFMGPEGYASYTRTEAGDFVIFEVTDVVPAEAAGNTEIETAISQNFSEAVYTGLVEGLRQDIGMRINEQTLNRLIGLE
ncbi:SurA N-terminal domain-containing protein [Pelagibacterium montanilacus]|uniref:SurA N-terminal domain-containing protein n=1 Tax=Pelagibacterium montanilacus TaxID=2185280 RepID=UPI000F8DCED6|nr:SurA N-terminal domain-containing protein [Pelagibacterium montanilacus]